MLQRQIEFTLGPLSKWNVTPRGNTSFRLRRPKLLEWLCKVLAQVKTAPSLGRTGAYWDTTAAESFFAVVTNQMYCLCQFTTQLLARFSGAEYLEVFYNWKRLHWLLATKPLVKGLTLTTPQALRHSQSQIIKGTVQVCWHSPRSVCSDSR